MTRFDYVKYDEQAKKIQADFKECFAQLSSAVEKVLSSPRAKALVLTKLEEAYMWLGKGIRDDQLGRNPETLPEEERNDS